MARITLLTEATGLSRTEAAATFAKGEYVAKQALPLRDMEVVANAADGPIPCGAFDDAMWASTRVSPVTISRSTDGGSTWEAYATGVPITSDSGIQRLLPTADGEVLACGTGGVSRSTGWASGTPTWTETLTNPTDSHFFAWGFDGDGTKFIVLHYAAVVQGFENSRYAWISLDGGQTWGQVWDTEAQFGAETSALTHLHGACYDPWEDRFFLVEGHQEPSGVYVSYDDGGTWAVVPYDGKDGFDPAADPASSSSPTVVVATDDGIVMGSDASNNGIYVLPRGATHISHAWAWGGVANTQLLGYAHQGFRDPATGVVYVVYVSDEADLPAPVAASDGRVAGQVWAEPGVAGMWRRIAVHDGQVCMWEQTRNEIARGSLGGIGQIPAHQYDTGRVLGGSVQGGRGSLAAGPEASAAGDDSVAVGGGATSADHNGTAVGAHATTSLYGSAFGANARAIGAGTALGRNAAAKDGSTSVGQDALTARFDCTAVGRNARAVTDSGSATVAATAVGDGAKANGAGGYPTAVGAGSVASAQATTALGYQASATHTESTAIGRGSATTRTYQTVIGPRDLEITDATKGVVLRSPNGTPHRITVGDDGALSATPL